MVCRNVCDNLSPVLGVILAKIGTILRAYGVKRKVYVGVICCSDKIIG